MFGTMRCRKLFIRWVINIRFLPPDEFIGDMPEQYNETLRRLRECEKRAANNGYRGISDSPIISSMIRDVHFQQEKLREYQERNEVVYPRNEELRGTKTRFAYTKQRTSSTKGFITAAPRISKRERILIYGY